VKSFKIKLAWRGISVNKVIFGPQTRFGQVFLTRKSDDIYYYAKTIMFLFLF